MTFTQAPATEPAPGEVAPRQRPRPRGGRHPRRLRRVSPGNGSVITTLGFSTLEAAKTWLTTAALVFLVVQVLSSLAMWGRLPGVTGSPAWAGPVHRSA